MVVASISACRSRAPAETLRYARGCAEAAGISEVTEITDRDCLGVPVFVSIRPQARGEVYTFGKGLDPVDAEIGAYMEALENHFAEPGAGRVSTRWGTARDVAGHDRADDAILDFGPLLRREIDLDAPLLLAETRDVETGAEGFLPVELVHLPAQDFGPSIFGSSSVGLASGNSVNEATAHALLELIERDIWSFEIIRSASKRVTACTLPDVVREIIDRAERNGLGLLVRTIANDYGLPFFAAFVFDESNPSRKTFNGGWACDLDRDSALVRAVTEAAQSRLAFIHGGRKVPPLRGARPERDEADLVRQHIRAVNDRCDEVSFEDIPDAAPAARRLDAVIERLRRVTQRPIYRVAFTPPEAPLQVVRVVVPTLENVEETNIRVGRRLSAAIAARAG